MIDKHYMRQVVVFYPNDKEVVMECASNHRAYNDTQMLKQISVILLWRRHLAQWLLIESSQFWVFTEKPMHHGEGLKHVTLRSESQLSFHYVLTLTASTHKCAYCSLNIV